MVEGEGGTIRTVVDPLAEVEGLPGHEALLELLAELRNDLIDMRFEGSDAVGGVVLGDGLFLCCMLLNIDLAE